MFRGTVRSRFGYADAAHRFKSERLSKNHGASQVQEKEGKASRISWPDQPSASTTEASRIQGEEMVVKSACLSGVKLQEIIKQ